MDGAVSPDGEGRLARPSERVDEACDRFEAAWRAGQQPRIEGFLVDADAADRPALLRELLALELELARAEGGTPTTDEYQERFPDCVEVVEAVFAEATSGLRIPPGAGRATRRSRRAE